MTILNHFQASTSPEKLRGRYYTPADLVRIILEEVGLRPGDVVLDPCCGDGEFLVGAVRHLAAAAPSAGRRAAGRALAPRLVGLDVDAEAVETARQRVRQEIRAGFGTDVSPDAICIRARSALDFPSRQSLAADLPPLARAKRLLVLGNPPYVEAKRLSAAARAELKRAYPEASTGAHDLYLYVLHACLGWLREEDRLAFVVPNKVLVNANARDLREGMLRLGQLRGITFASRAGVFPGAAVYPVVLYAGAPRPASGGAVRLSQVDRNGTGLCLRELPGLGQEAYLTTAARAFFPAAGTECQTEVLLDLVRQVREGHLGDVLEVRWSVSFHRRGLREGYITRRKPASPFARQILGGAAFSGNGEVARYGLAWDGWWIDYDVERLRRDRNPLPDPKLFAPPKIAICQNGRTVRAAYDDRGYVLKDVFLCGALRGGDHPLSLAPRAVVGLLCSRAVHFFYSHVFYGGHVNDGYLHFLRSFVMDVPLGRWTPAAAGEVAEMVRQREQATGRAAEALEECIEERVGEAFGLSAEHRAALDQWAAADPNWVARERLRRRPSPDDHGSAKEPPTSMLERSE